MKSKLRRSHGTGSLHPVVGSGGRETWYARWYVGKKRVQRRVGPKLSRSSSEGLTKKQAEAELRRMRLAEDEYPPPRSTMTSDAAFGQLLEHLQALGRRPTTLATYRSIYRSHLAWKLDEVPVEKVMRRDIEATDRAMVRKERRRRPASTP
jgi:hypothetical protein